MAALHEATIGIPPGILRKEFQINTMEIKVPTMMAINVALGLYPVVTKELAVFSFAFG